MGVSQERMPALFCHRIAEGLRSGRISYSDINNLQLDQATEFWTVIKGKPSPPRSRKPRRHGRSNSATAAVLTAPSKFPFLRIAR
ncbi:hypothetical protein [Mesorhizobium sp. M7A.F.Ce.TU.012.03.2.1]|uniref:hypothetical protein n=1 Tax=Mesorhizobium sp. M7A.F.Ce.TU.012.03.2.1 TaxID=2493681 RepID=UPI001FDFC9C3|nr:hypothetical protein [Mesorhizobium sp. M7A.F.Ce.TU.012.03.2.1]